MIGKCFSSANPKRHRRLARRWRAPHGDTAPASSETVEVDARGLEPPQPLVRILESLAALPAGAELRAWTDPRPIHLYAQLEERGFTAVTQEQANGSFLTHIRRR